MPHTLPTPAAATNQPRRWPVRGVTPPRPSLTPDAPPLDALDPDALDPDALPLDALDPDALDPEALPLDAAGRGVARSQSCPNTAPIYHRIIEDNRYI